MRNAKKQISTLLLFFVFSINANVVVEKDIIYSSVSPEFKNGLHYRFLQHIAEELDMSLKIQPLPFARRLLDLKNGKIDIMVGVHEDREQEKDLIFLYPSYETLKQTIFVKKAQINLFDDIENLSDLSLAVTIYGKYFPSLLNKKGPQLIKVSTLEQKILLLEKQRVDAFIHFKSSTIVMLKKMGLDKEIVPMLYQPSFEYHYYFAIGPQSRLMKHKGKIEEIIRRGVKNNTFSKIRNNYYQSLN